MRSTGISLFQCLNIFINDPFHFIYKLNPMPYSDGSTIKALKLAQKVWQCYNEIDFSIEIDGVNILPSYH